LGFEATAPRLGEVHVRDLRAALGHALDELDDVDVVVLAEEGGAIAARVELTSVRSGPSTRRAFVCPTCREPRFLLLARKGALQCNRHQRTRRQTELHRADFQRRGGLEEDKLLRLLLTVWRRRTPSRMKEAQRLADLLLRADQGRVAVLRQQLQTLTSVAPTG
jgi:hypothetical protein